VFGFDNPTERTFYHPFLDDKIMGIEQFSTMLGWSSSYYQHKSVTSRNLFDLVDYEDALTDPPPTLINMAEEERRKVMFWKPQLRWERWNILQPFNGQLERTHRFFDKSSCKYFPNCKIVLVWGDHTHWESIYAMWKVMELYEAKQKDGSAGRELTSVILPGANPFVNFFCV
jgi:hypothetical protein